MARKNKRHSPRIVPLQNIAERVGITVKKPVIHLPEPDNPEPIKHNEIRTRRRVWDEISPGKLRASYDGRE